jgi:2-octaprenyl-6-methoxyphenol hydroxylase
VPFGWIVDNQDLRVAQAQVVAETPNLTLIAPASITEIDARSDPDHVHLTLDDGRVISARLLVGADGRASQVRDHYRIRTRGWPYDHTAIVCTIRHTGAHDNIAVEHFRTDGPFAALPMTHDDDGCPRSGIVWSERPALARTIMAMDAPTFELALAARLPARYGTITLSGNRAAYPLTLQHAEDYTGTRMALIADAAHGIHPIAGQGLNLGMRDVADLADLVIRAHQYGDDIGDADLLDAYERARRPDNIGMIGATDMLTWLFGSRLPLIGPARRAGLMMIERIAPLKKFFIAQAMGGELATRAYAWDAPHKQARKKAA